MITQNTIGFYSVKIISIFIISILYFIVGFILSLLLNKFSPEQEKIEKLSTISLIIHISIIFGIIGISYYLLRINIKRMPFFLDGVYGFNYSLLKEASGGIIIGFILYNYLDKLKLLLDELKRRIDNMK
jgi:4-hydroxybenzoate polyprenyltransferase